VIAALAAALHIVVLPHAYADLAPARADAEALRAALARTEPFSRHEVRWHFVENTDDSVCEVRHPTSIAEQLSCKPEVNALLAPLKLARFKLVVLSRAEFTSSANLSHAGENSVVFLSAPREGPQLALTFLHELGHAFGLRDEQWPNLNPQRTEAAAPGPPNCAPDRATAALWWGDLVRKRAPGAGYFKGCAGSAEFIKPTEGGLMARPAPGASYGPVNERYLERALER
jgi:hypothetical protein